MHLVDNRLRLKYQYSNMAPRLSGQTSTFGVVFFVSKSLLGIDISNVAYWPSSVVALLFCCCHIVLSKPNMGRESCPWWYLGSHFDSIMLLC